MVTNASTRVRIVLFNTLRDARKTMPKGSPRPPQQLALAPAATFRG
eukprot:CAMPEP_0179272180 /NCGR_PEP_ID=MMETSP0797-20121207/32363_1 /TAXON_ID=47934 /ORGANISM="Dinophysis acuminata, Strain DAEP01" /LENGTH=45 /DNA_ID= /DNA_START= /DNA_END= /DNA_ORIENTATION=